MITLSESLLHSPFSTQVSFTPDSNLTEFPAPPAPITLKCTLDPTTGGFTYVRIPPSLLPYSYLQTKRWMVPMLRDGRRNSLYDRAIQAALFSHSSSSSSSSSASCLDIGTGSGLLALLSVKHGASHVTALEMSAPMSSIAASVISSNSSCW